MSLGDEIYLLAHDSDGKVKVAAQALDIGLAAAALLDLALAGKLDPLPARPAILTWMENNAGGSYTRVTQSMLDRGQLGEFTTRRMGLIPVTRLRPVDPERVVRLRARLRYAISTPKEISAPDAALCGLIRLMRLEARLYLDASTNDVLAQLDAIVDAEHPMLRDILVVGQAEIEAAAVSVYR